MPKRSSEASSQTQQYLSVAYQPWEAQARVHLSEARFRVVMAGRQSGKTMTGIAEICHHAMAYPNQICWWVAPSYRVKDRAWRGLIEFIPQQIIVSKSEANLRLQLGNGSWIFVKSADAPDSLVSEGLHFVVCDEAGQWKEDAWTRGIRPMLTVTNGKALFLGTPRGRNWFHRIWLRGEAKSDPEWGAFHWRTADSPYSNEDDLREARASLPNDLYRQEYEADPHDNAQAVFKNHRNCIGPMGEPDFRNCLGVDLARKIDFSAIVGLNAHRQVFYVERYQLDWAQQQQRIAAAAFRFAPNIPFLEVDATGVGDAFIPALRTVGMQVEPYVISSNQQKTALVDFLRIGFEMNLITIPEHDDLVHELDTFEFKSEEEDDDRKKKARVLYQYGAPPGGHDDLVMALALAYWGQRGIPIHSSARQTTNYMGGRRTTESYLR